MIRDIIRVIRLILDAIVSWQADREHERHQRDVGDMSDRPAEWLRDHFNPAGGDVSGQALPPKPDADEGRLSGDTRQG